MSLVRQAESLSISAVLRWHDGMVASLLVHREIVIVAVRSASAVADPTFFGMDEADLEDWFSGQRAELDNLTTLGLMASSEAALQDDYAARVDSRSKDPLTNAYHALRRRLQLAGWFGRKTRPDVDRHLLETIRLTGVVEPHKVGLLRDVLNLRHWLAHGRYWTLHLGKSAYTPSDVYRTIDDVLSRLPPVP